MTIGIARPASVPNLQSSDFAPVVLIADNERVIRELCASSWRTSRSGS